MNRDTLPVVVAIIGPTATGKTDLGIQLAKVRHGAVVSADSRQVYAGMNIGTAKPKEVWANYPHAACQADEIEGIPHYLFNMSAPTELVNLAQWQFCAMKSMDMLIQSGMTPLLVGGTMLYVDSVVFNYALPEVPPDEAWRQSAEAKSAAELYAELLRLDPSAEGEIDTENKRRLIRALEIVRATGQPLHKQRKQNKPKYQVEMIGLFPGWEELRERVQTRCVTWMQDGLLAETAQLMKQYGSDLPLLNTMNYRQAKQVLNKEINQEEAVAEMIKVNMRYAHRQMSWWRQRSEIKWFKSRSEAMQATGF